MPLQPHPACEVPPDDSVICRFMDMEKFRDFFASEELYFRRTDLFKKDDPWEGLPSEDYVRKIWGLRKGIIKDELKLNDKLAFIRQVSEMNYINCWQIFEEESFHMWDEYAKGTGVVVFSTVAKLKAAIGLFLDPVSLGRVKYTGEDSEKYNMINFLYAKRKHFKEERELRTFIECHDPLGNTNRHYDQNGIPQREPQDNLHPRNAWVPDCKRRRIALNDLVMEIRTSPWSTPEISDEVALWHKRKNLACLLNPSELTSSIAPTWQEWKNRPSG